MNRFVRKPIALFALCVMLLGLSACALTQHSSEEATVCATVMEIEKFGHVVLDVKTADLIANGYALGDRVCVRMDSYEADMPFYDGYYTNPGTVMLRGSTPESNIAICINYGDFSSETGTAVGDRVEITLVEKAGVLAVQELCALQYSNDRADYSDDTVYANFRAVTAGEIGDGKLYRTASPVNNEHGRAGYANALIAEAGVATILNLADSREEVEAFLAAEDFQSQYYREHYLSGNVAAINLKGNFFEESFAESVAEGLTFLAQKEAPYCIHCTEGKDRAGVVAMLLEALMGAELEEIIDDYMLSYYNYYGIDKENNPARYDTVLDLNLIPILCHVTGAETREELSQIDLESAVTKYLLNAGMAEADILTLKEKLG